MSRGVWLRSPVERQQFGRLWGGQVWTVGVGSVTILGCDAISRIRQAGAVLLERRDYERLMILGWKLETWRRGQLQLSLASVAGRHTVLLTNHQAREEWACSTKPKSSI